MKKYVTKCKYDDSYLRHMNTHPTCSRESFFLNAAKPPIMQNYETLLQNKTHLSLPIYAGFNTKCKV